MTSIRREFLAVIFSAVQADVAAIAVTRQGSLRASSRFLSANSSGRVARSGTLVSEYPFFHTSDEITAELKRLSQPNGCPGATFTVTSHTDSDTSIEMVQVKSTSAKPTNRVFLVANEHARELITGESALYFLRALCGDGDASFGDTPPATSLLGEVERRTDLDRSPSGLLAKSEFAVVLNGNPRSRRVVEEKGSYCLRANPRNVDLNRNWDEHWIQTGNAADGNSGTKPFSEPESRILRELIENYEPHTFLSIHSGTLGMYMPWAYSTNYLASGNQEAMMKVLQRLDEDHCQCPFGAAGKEVGYPCPGTSVDYAYDALKAPFSFAFEIWGGDQADLKDQWDEKVKERGQLLLQTDSPLATNLADPFYKDFFAEHPSDFVGLETSSRVEGLTTQQCLATFNPSDEESYIQVVQNWATVYADMSTIIAESLTKAPSSHSSPLS